MSWTKAQVKNGGWSPDARFVEVSAYEGACAERDAAIREREEALALLRRAFDVLCNMTTEEYQRGADKPVRDAIEPFLSSLDESTKA